MGEIPKEIQSSTFVTGIKGWKERDYNFNKDSGDNHMKGMHFQGDCTEQNLASISQ